MDNSKSGIEALLDDSYISPEAALKQFRREAAAKAGRGNAKRLLRLRDLALKVYSDECFNALKDLPGGQGRVADVQSRPELYNPLRPEYKVFLRKFLEATTNGSWEETERKWLKRLEYADLTESTLYGWWKSFNKDLSLILNNESVPDADGNLVFNGTYPE